jgi:glutathione synthase/RimK-type ligase-like ATP-grasp enzyme
MSDVDLSGDLLQAVAELIARLGKPVINHPDRIRPTDRFSVAETLADVPDCVVPRTVRYPRAALAAPDAVAAVPFDPPFLVRPAGTHGGDDLELVTQRDAVPGLLAGWDREQVYVSQFVDYRSEDGHFRKYRLIFVDGEILPYHLAIADDWKVHYYRTDMMHQAWMRQEEERFLRDPATAFDDRHFAALRAIRDAIDLDFFGIDCGIDRDGRLVVFEVNATMLVHAEDPDSVFGYKQAPVFRIKLAFDAMLARAAARPAR